MAILSYAKISVEVLNPNCWENCDDFEPWMASKSYATTGFGDTCIYTRYFKCINLDKCKRLSSYLERSE